MANPASGNIPNMNGKTVKGLPWGSEKKAGSESQQQLYSQVMYRDSRLLPTQLRLGNASAPNSRVPACRGDKQGSGLHWVNQMSGWKSRSFLNDTLQLILGSAEEQRAANWLTFGQENVRRITAKFP